MPTEAGLRASASHYECLLTKASTRACGTAENDAPPLACDPPTASERCSQRLPGHICRSLRSEESALARVASQRSSRHKRSLHGPCSVPGAKAVDRRSPAAAQAWL